ncbi:hypothetical protein EDD22DRAFT_905943 [Suillus occidentalis]|nr:hypothetical protein EDD22DRAFT_905943 [Suillus occidentalis]
MKQPASATFLQWLFLRCLAQSIARLGRKRSSNILHHSWSWMMGCSLAYSLTTPHSSWVFRPRREPPLPGPATVGSL